MELRGSVPLGAVRYASYEEVETRLDPGATLVLYTDGVIERPGEPLDAGLERLLEAATRADRDPLGICDAIVGALLPDGATRDDAALLAVRALPLSNPLELRLPADVDTIPTLRRLLGRWLGEAEASRTEVEEISLACSEACANAIEHAYAPGPAAIEVTATVTEDPQVLISVRDFGTWRPPRGSHRGRGMVLMKGLMDAVEVDKGDDGTTVRLARRLAGAPHERPPRAPGCRSRLGTGGPSRGRPGRLLGAEPARAAAQGGPEPGCGAGGGPRRHALPGQRRDQPALRARGAPRRRANSPSPSWCPRAASWSGFSRSWT